MASSLPLKDFFPEDDLLCPVCHDVFKDPVILSCSHSFCKNCLNCWWLQNASRQCPLCKRRSSKESPARNLVLKNLCEAVLKARTQRVVGAEELCSLHSEKFKLFCLEDKEPICVLCLVSGKHTSHNFRTIDEAAQDIREELKAKLEPLQDNLRAYTNFKQTYETTAEHIKIQAQSTEKHITELFEKLHQCLWDEEAVRIVSLREEAEQKSQMARKHIERTTEIISHLTTTIKSIEEKIKSQDIIVLLEYKAAVKRAQCEQQYPEMVSGALIHVGKHHRNLTSRILKLIEESVHHAPVILDPNTAHPLFQLSDDLSTVSLRDKLPLPNNPERFSCQQCVLGSEGFDSGCHCWDVEVGHNTAWSVGVCVETVKRKVTGFEGELFWDVTFMEGRYVADCHTHRHTPMKVNEKVQRIRVKLDWEKGILSFTNPLTGTHLHTFKHRFSCKVVPYLENYCKRHPLKIISAVP